MDNEFKPGTVHPENDYLEIERLGAKLGIPVPMMHITVEATNPDGSPGEVYNDRSRTYNRNFWNLIANLSMSPPAGTATFAAGFLAMKQTGGTIAAQDWQLTANNLHTGISNVGVASDTTYGIVVGTGSTAESFEHTALAALTGSGGAAGQMSYAAGTSSVSYDAGTRVWTGTLARVLNNNSGGTIVVAETGIYTVMWTSGTKYYYMTCRDLLGATVSVLDAGQLTVTYTITLTFPA